jgi:hypothetical protein
VFDGNGTSDGILEDYCYDLYVAMQLTGGQVREATSSFRGESEVVPELRNKVINSTAGLNEDGMLPVRGVQDRLSLGGKLLEERFRAKNLDKTENLMTNPEIRTQEAKNNGRRRQESGRESRSRNSSIGQQDIDFSSMSSSNREEFFDAPEEPFEGTISAFC